MLSAVVVSFILVRLVLFVTGTRAERSGGIVDTQDQLMALCKAMLLPGARPELPEEPPRRRRGGRGGAKVKAQQRPFTPSVPVTIMVKVRSSGKNMDELATLVKTQREFRECSVMFLAETWLHSCTPDPPLS